MKIKKTKFFYFGVALVFLYITSCNKQEATSKKPNILLICIDDLRPELNCYGADYISSPNIDFLAKSGIQFQKHFVNAPSCGPSRYTLLTGQYGPAGNNALFLRADKIKKGDKTVSQSMPEWFKSNGYTTVSVGKISHHPGGRGGIDWNDSTKIEMPNAWDKHLIPVAEWEHPRGMMHGLANGEIRKNPSQMDVYQSIKGNDDIYPDGLIANEAINQLKQLSNEKNKPFFLAVGLLKPHLPFGAPKSYLKKYENTKLPKIKHFKKPEFRTTWHNSNEFRQYNLWGKDPNNDTLFADELRKHYAACVSYADAQVGKLLDELKRTKTANNTIVVLWGDHGWHLGEHAIWGKHSLFEESLHSPLLIKYPKMKHVGAKTNAIVETLDIFPTLCDLAGIKIPEFADGVSLKNILEEPNKQGHPAVSYHSGAKTIRTEKFRMILHNDGFIELYDHNSKEKESKNIAQNNAIIVNELKKAIKNKLN